MMRKTLCASVLLLALCVPAFAGDIINPPAPVNSNDSTSVTQPSGDQQADGWSGDETSDPSADGITAAALTLLDTVLALL